MKVRDIGTTQHLIGSSLTAVDLVGLTRIELVFAVIMVAGAAGLFWRWDWPTGGAASPSSRRWERNRANSVLFFGVKGC